MREPSSAAAWIRYGFAQNLPFDDGTFTKALAINSMRAWPDAVGGLREMRRVLAPHGRIALGFTSYSGQSKDAVPGMITAAGFIDARVVETEKGFCVLAVKP